MYDNILSYSCAGHSVCVCRIAAMFAYQFTAVWLGNFTSLSLSPFSQCFDTDRHCCCCCCWKIFRFMLIVKTDWLLRFNMTNNCQRGERKYFWAGKREVAKVSVCKHCTQMKKKTMAVVVVVVPIYPPNDVVIIIMSSCRWPSSSAHSTHRVSSPPTWINSINNQAKQVSALNQRQALDTESGAHWPLSLSVVVVFHCGMH